MEILRFYDYLWVKTVQTPKGDYDWYWRMEPLRSVQVHGGKQRGICIHHLYPRVC